MSFYVGWASVFLPTIIASVGNKRTLPTLHKSENYARAEYSQVDIYLIGRHASLPLQAIPAIRCVVSNSLYSLIHYTHRTQPVNP